ncbi:SMI1/KNR4 family protein [Corallococcus sp. EGB]|uniref:SMI1/KNR4 family protein n=1 Tax=Corallococcus sp. EGB TaxID=1521117 RepID=UPI001CC007B7|nr:SMI1/KNR4 family protein [Corallococcus sp. EGB]
MHEWLESLRKSAKTTSEGVQAEEVRRAETECGVPFPEDLADLYQALNGGEFQGEVRLYPLHGGEGEPSVLEKSRLMVVGLPAAGVWRFGLKGTHRHLFVARKSAMEEQGDGGGPLPGWVDALDGEDWVFGTWDGEKKDMRMYRSLKDMLEVLIPPVEEKETFGERTFARAMNAVLQGALSGAAARVGDEGEEADTDAADAEAFEAAEAADEDGFDDEGEAEVSGEEELEEELAEDTGEAESGADEDVRDEEAPEQEELFEEAKPKRPAAKKARREPPITGAPAAPAKKGAAAKKSAPARGAAKKGAPAKKATVKAAAKKSPVKKGATAKKGAAQKRGAAKKAAAKKATGKATAKKGAVQKRGAAAKKGAARKRGAAKKAPARRSAAKKSSRRRS